MEQTGNETGNKTRNEKIAELSSSQSINLVLDTIKKQKQALVFVNTKRGAEKQAEDIAKKMLRTSDFEQNRTQWKALAEKAEKALESPTGQCRRLAFCLKSGIAFHHAGLAAKQRELIEESFRNRTIKTICCTPTLAYGLDLPAYRVIIRDLKRFTHHGMDFIPVMEYHQQAGRAGRPNYDTRGEAIVIAKTESEAELLLQKYVLGEPEEIYSKLAVEPVLRTYILSLVSAGLISSRASCLTFFKKSFWAYQFADMHRLEHIIDRMIALLAEWEFLYSIRSKPPRSSSFVSADELEKDSINKGIDTLRATRLGKRVSELYLDPLTARQLIVSFERLQKEKGKLGPYQLSPYQLSSYQLSPYPLLHMLCMSLEMRPLLSLRAKDYDRVEEFLVKYSSDMLVNEPTSYDPDHEEYMRAAKTALALFDWIDEKEEEYLLETHSIRPGELRVKLSVADWLLYCSSEMLRMLKMSEYRKDIAKCRTLLKYGAREELLPLLRLRDVGRVRARKMFRAGIKSIADVKRANIAVLGQLIGREVAAKVKKQLDQDPEKETVRQNKRKGQISVRDF